MTLDHRDLADEEQTIPGTFVDHANGDGIAFSSDGTTWHKLTDLSRSFVGETFDLDAAVQSAGISYSANFRIKFQQYDNFPDPQDGRVFDNIRIDVDAEDHGNDALTATAVAIVSSTGGNIEVPNDVDWFAVTAVAGVQYDFLTTVDGHFDSLLRLIDRDGMTELERNDRGGPGAGSRIIWTAPISGIYYLEVSGLEVSGKGGTGTYALHVFV